MTDNDLDLLLRALDDELADPDRDRLQQLLATSPDARAAWQQHRAVRTAVAAQAAPSFGPYFADRVMQRLARERGAHPRRGGAGLPAWLTPAGAVGWGLAVAVLLAAVGLALWLRPQTIHVPYGQTASHTLPDGSTVELAGGSTLTYARPWGRGERRVSLDGEAFFAVARQEVPFVVETFNARVEVLGTRFNVSAWPDAYEAATTVTLASGRVAVAPLAAPAAPVVLAPGEATTIAADTTHPALPAPASLDRVLAWRSGGLAFTDRPLASVFETLQRRFDVAIALDDADLAAERITYLAPRPASAEDVLADICHIKQLRYRRTANGFEVLSD